MALSHPKIACIGNILSSFFALTQLVIYTYQEDYSMAFHKEKLKTYLKSQGLTQGDLAALVGKDIRTVRRWLSPKEPLRPKAIEKICEALQVNPSTFDTDWPSTQSWGQEVQVGAQISQAAANGYLLLRREFGITKKQLIELAPAMFAVIAERALSRIERLASNEANLAMIARALGLRDSSENEYFSFPEKAMYYENAKSAAKDRAIFGLEEIDEYGPSNPNLFADEIDELSEGVQGAWRRRAKANECPGSGGFRYSRTIVDYLTCGDENLATAIANGSINLSIMEDHLWVPENKDERLRWLRQQATNATLREQRGLEKTLSSIRERNPELAKRLERIYANQRANVFPLERNERNPK